MMNIARCFTENNMSNFWTMVSKINYYNLNKSPVYMCMLDVSKAFDKVNLLLLFNKLRLKGMCSLL